MFYQKNKVLLRPKTGGSLFLMAASFLVLGCTSIAQAANVFWDTDSSSPGLGGTGTWSISNNPFWLNVGNGTNPGPGLIDTSDYTFNANDFAYFTGNGGVVTLVDDMTLSGLVFRDATFTILVDESSRRLTAKSVEVGAGSQATIYAEILSSSGGFTKSGPGKLVLANSNNAITGDVSVDQGTLEIGDGGTNGAITGSGKLVLLNSTLIFNRSDAITFGRTIDGSFQASLIHQGTGQTTLTGAPIRGTLFDPESGAAFFGYVTINAGELIAAASDLFTTGSIEVNSGGTFTARAGSLGSITGGNGSLGINMTLNGGSFRLFDGVNGTHGMLKTLNLNGGSVSIGAVANSNTPSLGVTVALNVTENSIISGGNITFSSNWSAFFSQNNFAIPVTVASGKTLTITGNLIDLYEDGTNGFPGNNPTWFDKQGDGTLVLTGANNYSGPTIVSGGTLQIGDGGAVGTLETSAISIGVGATLVLNRSGSITMNNSISGAGRLIQRGMGRAILAGSNTYTGSTTIENGVLQVSASSASADVLNNSSGVIINGIGTFEYSGYSSGSTENVGGLTLMSGHGLVRVIPGATGATSLSFASLTRGIGATVTFAPGAGAGVQFIAASAGTNGILGGYATIVNPMTHTVDFVANPTVNTSLAAFGSTVALVASGGSATGNYVVNASTGSITTTSVVAANTLRIAGGDVVLGGDLIITSTSISTLGGILHDNTEGAATISGSFAIRTSAPNQELIITTAGNNTANALMLSANISNDVGRFTKAGEGLLILTSSSVYNGPISIAGGTLQIGDGGTAGMLGTGMVSIAKGASLTFKRSDDLVLNNAFSNSGSLLKQGTNTLTLTGISTFVGDTTISAGTLSFTSGALGSGTSSDMTSITVGNGARLQWSGSNNSDDLSQRISVPENSTAKLDVGANNVTFGSAPTVGAGAMIEKEGTGTLTLDSSVSATMLDINVLAGRLAVNGMAGDIQVEIGGELGGTGIVGDVEIGMGGSISPGTSPGILTAASLTLNGGSIFEWEVRDATAGAGLGYDTIHVSGAIDLTGASSGNKITLKLISLGATGLPGGNPLNLLLSDNRSFTLATFGSLNLSSGVNITDLFAFDLSEFRYSNGNMSRADFWSISSSGNLLTFVTAVPEPSTYGLGIGALAIATATIRRRRRKN